MEAFGESIAGLWQLLTDTVKSIGFIDVLDIALVAVLLYLIYKFIRDRRAGKLASGIVILVLLLIFSNLFGMNAMKFLMQNVFQVGLLALVVVFQPELRSALEKVGGEPLKSLRSIGENKDEKAMEPFFRSLCDAVIDLSSDMTGALIVIERTTKLGDIIKSGTVLNADMSSFLLKNIFFNKAPMHDGAVVLRGDRIYAAGCFLPLSGNAEIIKDLGSRHRAGIGMSENSDAVVIIVSEETGTISVAEGGNLKRGFNYNSLYAELRRVYLTEATVKKITKRIRPGSKGSDDHE